MRRSPVLLAVGLALASSVASADDDVAQRLASVELGVSRGTPPQPERASELFRRARPMTEEGFRGLLVCSVRVPGDHWDGSDPFGPVRRFMGRIDLNAVFRIDGEVVARWYGPEDQSTATVALPGLSLARGQRITVEVEDRDVVRDDEVGRVTLGYDGTLPLRASEGRIEVECRGIPESQLEDRIGSAIDEADAAMADLPDPTRPDPAVLHFRRSELDERRAELAVYDLARWVGLADPRVRTRLERLAERQRVFEQRAGEVVEALRSGAAAPGTSVRIPGSPYSVSVEGLACDLAQLFELRRAAGLDTQMTCALRLVLSHGASSPQAVGFAAHVVESHGETTEARPILLDDGSDRSRFPPRARLPRGEHPAVFAIDASSPVLLRLSTRSGVAWARIDPPNAP